MSLDVQSAIPRELWLADLKSAAESQPPWVWQGYLAPGNVTLLTSQWKSGKTTLVSVLLSRMKKGGTLAGQAVSAGKAAVVSEEDPTYWFNRSLKLDFDNHVCWLCRPFRGKPRFEEWLALLDRLAELHGRHGLSLVVIDPLAGFLPGRDENSAGPMLESLMSLQRLTSLGLSVLLLHHPRKGETLPGQAARGSGALCAYVDILLEMQWYKRTGDNDRRRRLSAFSRHAATPRQLVIELSADGSEYLVHGDFAEEEFSIQWKILRLVLEDAAYKLTRQKLLKEWPPDYVRPADVTLWRWLEQGVQRGLLCRDGDGRRATPFRYWLPEREEIWKNEPVMMLMQQADQSRQILFEKWRMRKEPLE